MALTAAQKRKMTPEEIAEYERREFVDTLHLLYAESDIAFLRRLCGVYPEDREEVEFLIYMNEVLGVGENNNHPRRVEYDTKMKALLAKYDAPETWVDGFSMARKEAAV